MQFLAALGDHGFLQNALFAGLLAALGCGIIGSYVVVKRLTFLAGGIAHTVLAGMGIAYFLGGSPLLGALIAALIAALIIGLIKHHAMAQEDTLIGALWAVGMAIGILFISRTPGYNADLMSYLFGNILMVPRQDLWLMLALDGVIVLLVAALHPVLQAVCFDEEYARLRGVPVTAVYLLLLCMVALTVVLLIQVVGLILVIALLTLPAAIALPFSGSLIKIMALAVVLGALFTLGGLMVSFEADLPSGATIILLAGAAYILSLAAQALFRRASPVITKENP